MICEKNFMGYETQKCLIQKLISENIEIWDTDAVTNALFSGGVNFFAIIISNAESVNYSNLGH